MPLALGDAVAINETAQAQNAQIIQEAKNWALVQQSKMQVSDRNPTLYLDWQGQSLYSSGLIKKIPSLKNSKITPYKTKLFVPKKGIRMEDETEHKTKTPSLTTLSMVWQEYVHVFGCHLLCISKMLDKSLWLRCLENRFMQQQNLDWDTKCLGPFKVENFDKRAIITGHTTTRGFHKGYKESGCHNHNLEDSRSH